MKAARLRPGDTIGIVSPSWGGPAAYPHRLDNGVSFLKSQGYRVRVATHARDSAGFVSGTPEARVSDIHELFADPAVTAIVASIGGDHSCHLLPHLDFDLIRENPKIFMGYSDITVLNVAIWQRTGLVTFNGPALMTDFAEFVAILQKKLPNTTLHYVAVKPSIKRWKLIDQVRRTNELVKGYCDMHDRLFFVDIAAPMLDEKGNPRPELFVKDELHLSEAGYSLWNAKTLESLKKPGG